jgi:hypothetical protein
MSVVTSFWKQTRANVQSGSKHGISIIRASYTHNSSFQLYFLLGITKQNGRCATPAYGCTSLQNKLACLNLIIAQTVFEIEGIRSPEETKISAGRPKSVSRSSGGWPHLTDSINVVGTMGDLNVLTEDKKFWLGLPTDDHVFFLIYNTDPRSQQVYISDFINWIWINFGIANFYLKVLLLV